MKKVLLLGAGYGVLSFLKSLPKEVYEETEFTLISKTTKHYHSILLHEVASGAKDQNILFPIAKLISNKVNFIQDEVLEIKKGEVRCKAKTHSYDYLIVGLGFQSDTFNIPGIKEFAHSLVNYQEATEIKEKVYQSLDDFKNGKIDTVNIVVCGGGLSGVELVSSFAEELTKKCKQLKIDLSSVKITCVEALPKVLPMLSEFLSKDTEKYLRSVGISVETNCKVLECKEDSIIVEQNGEKKTIPSTLTIWTAGVKGSSVIENSPFFTSKRSRVEVDRFMKPINQENQLDMENVFILGDCGALLDETTGRFYPPTAQIACQEGSYLGKVFKNYLQGKEVQKKFVFNYQGVFCSVGHKYAVGMFANAKELRGLGAVVIKQAIEAKWQIALEGIKGIRRSFS